MAKQQNQLFGIILMIICSIFITISWAGVKLAGQTLPLFEIVFFRAFFSCLFLLPLMLKRSHSLKPKQPKLLLIRSFFGAVSMIMIFYSLKYFEIGNTSALFNTMPIFVALLAPLLSTESFHRKSFFMILISFGGICLIVKPDSNLLSNEALMALGSAFFMAIATVQLRKLYTTENTAMITFYFAAMMALLSLISCILDYTHPSLFEWGLLLTVGVTVTIAQLLGTKAYDYGDATIITPFSYVTVILSYLLGVLFWNEVPDLASIFGALIITLSGVLILRGRSGSKLQ